MVNMTIVLSCTAIVFVVSKHWKKLFVYLLPPLLVMTYVGMVVKIWLLQDEKTKEEWTIERHNELQVEMIAIMIGFFAYLTLFCPSLGFLLGIYGPIYLITHLTQMFLRYDMSDKKVFTQNALNLAMLTFTGFLFFYLVQSKELIRFFDN